MSSITDHGNGAQPSWLKIFLTIWTGQSLSLLGSALTKFVLIWWLAKETDSVQVLATVVICGFIPDIVVMPLVGAVVDRWDRRCIMLAADGSMMALTLWLAALFATGSMTLTHIYLYQFGTSVGQVFQRTALVAATPQLVPLRSIPRIQGLNTFLWGVFSLAPPPLAALLLTMLNLETILLIDAATSFFAIAPLLFLRFPSGRPVAQANGSNRGKEDFWQHLMGGAIYLSRNMGLLALLVSVALSGLLLIPVATYLPLLVKNHFGGGARELGWVESAWGGGVICGGALLGLRKGTDNQITIMLVAMAGVGIGYGVLALLPGALFFWTLPTMLAIGALCAVAGTPPNTILQAKVPTKFLGRVWVIHEMAYSVFSMTGLAISALLAKGMEVRKIMLVCALLYGICAIIGFFIPTLRALDYKKRRSDSIRSIGRTGT